MQLDIFEPLHGSVEVEIGDIDRHELRSRRGDNAVEKDFEQEHVRGGRTDVVGVLDRIATQNEATPIGFRLLWPDYANELAIRYFFEPIGRDLMFVNEKTRVGRFLDAIADALEKPAELICRGDLPIVPKLGMTQKFTILEHFPRVNVEHGVSCYAKFVEKTLLG